VVQRERTDVEIVDLRMELDKSRRDFRHTQRLHRLERNTGVQSPSRGCNNNDDHDHGNDDHDDHDDHEGDDMSGSVGFELDAHRGSAHSITTQSSTLSFSISSKGAVSSRGVAVERLADELDELERQANRRSTERSRGGSSSSRTGGPATEGNNDQCYDDGDDDDGGDPVDAATKAAKAATNEYVTVNIH
jgi:hypothetical protein